MSDRREKSILLIAGEVSGDMHAADIVRAIQRRAGNVKFFGIGGSHLRQTGMEIVFDTADTAVLGLWEVLKKYGFFRHVFQTMLSLARTRRPDAVLLVDYPGFNLRFAAAAKALGLKVIYYVCPQIWAWRRGRIKQIVRNIDRLLAIFPFEPALFAGTSLPVDFVGHPLVEATAAARAVPPAILPWQDGAPRLALLPGSRSQEIQRLLPVMLETVLLLEKQFPHLACIFAAPSPATATWLIERLDRFKKRRASVTRRLAVVVGQTREILRQASAALVASGTATVETALLSCPMVVVYKVALSTYLLGRLVIRVPYLGMVNLLWRHLDPQAVPMPLCPEFIQCAAQPSRLAAALAPLLTNTPQRQTMLAGLQRVSAALGRGDAAERAAEIILREIS